MIYVYRIEKHNGCVSTVSIPGVIKLKDEESFDVFNKTLEDMVNPRRPDDPPEMNKMIFAQYFEGPTDLTEDQILFKVAEYTKQDSPPVEELSEVY